MIIKRRTKKTIISRRKIDGKKNDANEAKKKKCDNKAEGKMGEK